MKHLNWLIGFWALWPALASGQISPLNEVEAFGPNPGNLKMYLHRVSFPAHAPARRPLVVVLHGCSQSAETCARVTGWGDLGARFHFYVLYAQQRTLNNVTSCFNWFQPTDVLPGKGEVASIRQMVAHAVATLPIDTTQLFIYGLSAGGAMASAALACYPAVFRGGAVLAGGPYLSNGSAFGALGRMTHPPHLMPAEWATHITRLHPGYAGPWPRLVVMHGDEDNLVSPRCSRELVHQWVGLWGIADTLPSIVEHPLASAPHVWREVYSDSTGQNAIVFYGIRGMGHALPIDPGEDDRQGGQPGAFAQDRDFFSTYWIARDFGIVR